MEIGKEKRNSVGEIPGWPSTSVWVAVPSTVDGWGQPHEYEDTLKMLAGLEQLLSTIAKDLGVERRKADRAVAATMAWVDRVLNHPDWDPLHTSSADEGHMWEDVMERMYWIHAMHTPRAASLSKSAAKYGKQNMTGHRKLILLICQHLKGSYLPLIESKLLLN